MKKLLFSAVTFLCFFTIAGAQVTDATLQGEWKIEAIELPGIYYEITTGNLRLSEEMITQEGEPAPEEMEMLKGQMKEQVAPFASNYIAFNKNNIKIHYGEADREGTYRIKQKDNRNFIVATYSTGAVKEVEFMLKNGLLYLVMPEKEGAGNMVFKHS